MASIGPDGRLQAVLLAATLAACGSLAEAPAPGRDASAIDASPPDAVPPDAAAGGVVVQLRAGLETSYALVVVTDRDGELIRETRVASGESLQFDPAGDDVIHVARFDAQDRIIDLTTLLGARPGDTIPVGPIEPAMPTLVGELAISFEPAPGAVDYQVGLACPEAGGSSDGSAVLIEVASSCVSADGRVTGVVLAASESGLGATAWFDVAAPTAARPTEVTVGDWKPLRTLRVVVSPLSALFDQQLPLFARWYHDGERFGEVPWFGSVAGENEIAFDTFLVDGFVDRLELSIQLPRPSPAGFDLVHELDLRLEVEQLTAAELVVDHPLVGGPIAAFYDDGVGVFEWLEEPVVDAPSVPVMTVVRYGGWLLLAPPELASPLRVDLHGIAPYLTQLGTVRPSVGRVYMEEGEAVDYHELLRSHGSEALAALRRRPDWTRLVLRRNSGGAQF